LSLKGIDEGIVGAMGVKKSETVRSQSADMRLARPMLADRKADGLGLTPVTGIIRC